MCIASGVWLMKSKTRLRLLASKVTGSGFCEWMKSGNLIASRMKKTAEVVADEIPVAVLGVELDGEAARVAGGLGGVAAAGDGGEADGEVGALALLLEQLGAGVLRDRLVADRAVRLEVAVGDDAAGVDDALGDALAVEVADLLEELVVLQRRRPAGADGALVLVVVDRVALAVGQDRGGRRPRRAACWRRSCDGPLVLSLAVGAGAHVRHGGLVEHEAVRILRFEAGREPHRAVHVGGQAPQWRHTTWWWLSPARASSRIGLLRARSAGRGPPG